MIKKLPIKLVPNAKDVILMFFQLNEVRTKKIIRMVLSLSDEETNKILNNVFSEFSRRHKSFEEILMNNYSKVKKFVPHLNKLSSDQKLLIGAYFSKEYSINSAALFNPSMVPHPDQSNLKKDSLRFIISMRATGEGHISSIKFREGIVDNKFNVKLDKSAGYSCLPQILVLKKDSILKTKLKFTKKTKAEIEDLLDSNYRISFSKNTSLDERIIFPHSKSESVGMEDARFVKFTDKNTEMYYGTYTAYNGKTFRTQLIETNDFVNFKISTLHGNAIKDKGMALFPRKINGKYVITSRQDTENIFIMTSDNLYNWNNAQIIKKSKQAWEFIQIGNCGSPIETEKGWILLTHAVGPMRKYVISAVLLDIDNPSNVIGTLKEPLIQPNKEEREGYVPNVVYSCGSVRHQNNIIIPYAFSDSACGFATISITELLNKLK
jgi:predicted GH43/DUF377 family glycosyl hydrolase